MSEPARKETRHERAFRRALNEKIEAEGLNNNKIERLAKKKVSAMTVSRIRRGSHGASIKSAGIIATAIGLDLSTALEV